MLSSNEIHFQILYFLCFSHEKTIVQIYTVSLLPDAIVSTGCHINPKLYLTSVDKEEKQTPKVIQTAVFISRDLSFLVWHYCYKFQIGERPSLIEINTDRNKLRQQRTGNSYA